MGSLIDKLNQDLVYAQKNGDKVSISTLRLLLSEIKNAQIAKGKELTDEEIIEVAAKSAKKSKESIEAYKKGNRDDLVEREETELEVLGKYLPKQMGKEEIGKIIDEVIRQTQAASIADMGKVIGQVMAKIKGKADGEVVSEITKKKLSS